MTAVKTLNQWLDSLNQYKIDLGLSRITQVLSRAPFSDIKQPIITVAGTNGKGSTVTATTTLLRQKNLRVGSFTSPHIFRYNERIQINGQPATDSEIVLAFEAINQARGDIELSYFEYALLAALLIFHQHKVDYMVLEVGLGGRLDAVNALSSVVAIITSVDLDHCHWLGEDIETIAAEKAAIMRSGCPIIYGDANCPQAIVHRAEEHQAELLQWQKHYQTSIINDSFSYHFREVQFTGLPKPAIPGDFQVLNFSAALTALLSLGLEFSQHEVNSALNLIQLPGRIQKIQDNPQVIVDVAHNRQSVKALAVWLHDNPINGRTRAVFSVLEDKQAESWLQHITSEIDHWFIFQLGLERATELNTLKMHIANHNGLISAFSSGKDAYEKAINASDSNDRLIVFGSFHVLDEVFHNTQSLSFISS